MIKMVEEMCDKFTSKNYEFEVNDTYANEVLSIIYSLGDDKLLKRGKYAKEVMIKIYKREDIIYYGLEVYLTDNEWFRLLNECDKHNYQLIIKRNHNQMCFTKKES